MRTIGLAVGEMAGMMIKAVPGLDQDSGHLGSPGA
jgi:hypothetical protein